MWVFALKSFQPVCHIFYLIKVCAYVNVKRLVRVLAYLTRYVRETVAVICDISLQLNTCLDAKTVLVIMSVFGGGVDGRGDGALR